MCRLDTISDASSPRACQPVGAMRVLISAFVCEPYYRLGASATSQSSAAYRIPGTLQFRTRSNASMSRTVLRHPNCRQRQSHLRPGAGLPASNLMLEVIHAGPFATQDYLVASCIRAPPATAGIEGSVI